MGAVTGAVNDLMGGASNNASYQSSGAGSNPTQGIKNPTTMAQAQLAYGDAQTGLQQQEALLAALQAQNGLSNQSSVYNQMQGVANGTGPNPAQAMLNQATGQNVANQAAMMAGQRGAAGNVGLMARQNALIGANAQQQAVGQGATMQANQSMNALGQMGNMANTMAGQQVSGTNNLSQATQNEQANILNGINGQNASNVGMQSNINSTNSAMAQTNANNTAGAVGGLINGAGGLAAMFSKGGIVGQSSTKVELPEHFKHVASIYHPQHFADGGYVAVNPMAVPTDPSPGDQAIANNSPLKDKKSSPAAASQASPASGQAMAGGSDASDLSGAALMVASKGAVVPGKAKVKGDSPKNDTVPAMLSPGEVVIPRHVLESDNAPEAAKVFVAALLAKQGKKPSDKEADDFKGALKKAIGSRKK